MKNNIGKPLSQVFQEDDITSGMKTYQIKVSERDNTPKQYFRKTYISSCVELNREVVGLVQMIVTGSEQDLFPTKTTKKTIKNTMGKILYRLAYTAAELKIPLEDLAHCSLKGKSK